MTHGQTVWNSVIAAWRGDMKAKIAQLSVAVALNGGEPVKITKEEKKMLNHEKFARQLEQAEPEERACAAAALRGIYCQENWNDVEECYDCMKESMAWLYEKADEPKLLKNGDGLKPGDEIMVSLLSDDTDWRKLKFVVFHNGFFYTESNVSKDLIPWARACLPEDGE